MADSSGVTRFEDLLLDGPQLEPSPGALIVAAPAASAATGLGAILSTIAAWFEQTPSAPRPRRAPSPSQQPRYSTIMFELPHHISNLSERVQVVVAHAAELLSENADVHKMIAVLGSACTLWDARQRLTEALIDTMPPVPSDDRPDVTFVELQTSHQPMTAAERNVVRALGAWLCALEAEIRYDAAMMRTCRRRVRAERAAMPPPVVSSGSSSNAKRPMDDDDAGRGDPNKRTPFSSNQNQAAGQ
jgi:hypothetical protein